MNQTEIFHNASFCNTNVHTRARFRHEMVHCGKYDLCFVGFVQLVYYVPLAGLCSMDE